MSQVQLLVKRLSDNATIPTRGSPFSAGYDLYAASSCNIGAHSVKIVPTDLSIAISSTDKHNMFYGRVAPRSSLACKFIDVGAGVIGN